MSLQDEILKFLDVPYRATVAFSQSPTNDYVVVEMRAFPYPSNSPRLETDAWVSKESISVCNIDILALAVADGAAKLAKSIEDKDNIRL